MELRVFLKEEIDHFLFRTGVSFSGCGASDRNGENEIVFDLPPPPFAVHKQVILTWANRQIGVVYVPQVPSRGTRGVFVAISKTKGVDSTHFLIEFLKERLAFRRFARRNPLD